MTINLIIRATVIIILVVNLIIKLKMILKIKLFIWVSLKKMTLKMRIAKLNSTVIFNKISIASYQRKKLNHAIILLMIQALNLNLLMIRKASLKEINMMQHLFLFPKITLNQLQEKTINLLSSSNKIKRNHNFHNSNKRNSHRI